MIKDQFKTRLPEKTKHIVFVALMSSLNALAATAPAQVTTLAVALPAKVAVNPTPQFVSAQIKPGVYTAPINEPLPNYCEPVGLVSQNEPMKAFESKEIKRLAEILNTGETFEERDEANKLLIEYCNEIPNARRLIQVLLDAAMQAKDDEGRPLHELTSRLTNVTEWCKVNKVYRPSKLRFAVSRMVDDYCKTPPGVFTEDCKDDELRKLLKAVLIIRVEEDYDRYGSLDGPLDDSTRTSTAFYLNSNCELLFDSRNYLYSWRQYQTYLRTKEPCHCVPGSGFDNRPPRAPQAPVE